MTSARTPSSILTAATPSPGSQRIRTSLLAILSAALLAGCASHQTGQKWTRSEVFFGLSRPDGSLVTDAQWQEFVAEVVTPQFPAGLSVVDTNGQWREASGRIARERSKVLVLLHPADRRTEARIDTIRREYCHRFQQEAVMKVSTVARVEF